MRLTRRLRTYNASRRSRLELNSLANVIMDEQEEEEEEEEAEQATIFKDAHFAHTPIEPSFLCKFNLDCLN